MLSTFLFPPSGRVKLAGYCSCIMMLLIANMSRAQSMTGKVVDAETGAPLAGVLIIGQNDSTVAGSDGQFKLSSPGIITISHVGYHDAEIDLMEDYNLISLEPKPYELEGVVVNSFVVSGDRTRDPLVVNRLSRAQLNQFDPTIITPALNTVPGVFMQSGALNTNRIAIRGIGSRSPFSTNKIRAYFGEIPLTNGTGETTIEDIDLSRLGRLEIIKGPSATLYGSGLGGTMLLYPRRALNNELTSSTTVGAFGLFKQDLSATLKAEHGSNNIFTVSLARMVTETIMR